MRDSARLVLKTGSDNLRHRGSGRHEAPQGRYAMSTPSKESLAERVETIVEFEKSQVERANSLKKQPVVFVHGLWLLPSSWNRWTEMFEAAGYTALTPGWPDDPTTVQEANANPGLMAGKTVGQI